MEFLIKNALIIHPYSDHHFQRFDLLIEDGLIKKIGKRLEGTQARLIQSENLHCSVGWLDIGTHLGEPGYEHRETTDSLCQAASRGGFTGIAPFPTTQPLTQSASDVQYLKYKFERKLQEYIPIASLSKDGNGQDLPEMLDLIHNGVKGFTDGLSENLSDNLLLRGLLYLKNYDATVIHFPYSSRIANGGQIHEGKTSVMHGLPGIPEIAEIIPLKKSLDLTSYSEGRMLVYGISSDESLKLIKDARKNLPAIHASVPYLNLVATDNDVAGFKVNYKVLPPLRTLDTQKKLIKGVINKHIQVITTNHCPLEEERKMLEFPYADFGATGLETCFAALASHVDYNTLLDLIPALSIGPREALGVTVPDIAENAFANLTLFDPDRSWTYDRPSSISKNNPFYKKELSGQVVGVIRGKKSMILE